MRRTLCALALALTLTVPALAAGFTDVPAGAWYAEAVGEVSAQGLMKGTTETAFSPDAYVTRGMVVTVLWRLAGAPAPQCPASFTDLQDWYYYNVAVAWAEENGIATGMGDGTFGGGATVTREQLAVFLYRYAKYAGDETASGVLTLYDDEASIHAWAREGMAHAVGAGLMTGVSDDKLLPSGAASRAQLAVILQRLMTPAFG